MSTRAVKAPAMLRLLVPAPPDAIEQWVHRLLVPGGGSAHYCGFSWCGPALLNDASPLGEAQCVFISACQRESFLKPCDNQYKPPSRGLP